MKLRHLFFASLLLSPLIVCGEDSVNAPRPVPLTRPEMKRLLEDMKQRKPRIPLPEPTAEEEEKLAAEGGRVGGGYEGRLRSVYGTSFGGFGGGGGRGGVGAKAGEKAGDNTGEPGKTEARGGFGGPQESDTASTRVNPAKQC